MKDLPWGPTPAMLTQDERLHLAEVASLAPDGRFVELGTFLGASTECLLAGAGDKVTPDRPMIAHDAFVTSAYMRDTCFMPFREGESFRPMFDLFHRERLDRLDVREGWVPMHPTESTPREVYPEQEPIGLLFIDLAKTSGIHRTVLDAFAPNLVKDAIVIQQDFKYPNSYWLPIHMHALPEHFEPTHDVPGWTVTFRCVKTPGSTGARSLTDPSSDAGASEIAELWASIAEWLRACGMYEAADASLLQGAMHHLACGHDEAVASAVRRFIDACERASETVSPTERIARATNATRAGWRLREAAVDRDPDGPLQEAASALEGWVSAPGMGDRAIFLGVAWRQLALRLKAEGRHRVVLMGAGDHAREVLATGWPHGTIELVAVLDDAAKAVAGRPVLRPEAVDQPIDAVVVCGRQLEAKLASRARDVFGPDVPVVTVYSRAT